MLLKSNIPNNNYNIITRLENEKQQNPKQINKQTAMESRVKFFYESIFLVEKKLN